MHGNDLAIAERQAFRSVVDTGLWDIVIASVLAMFAIAPLLSTRLGDFGSTAIFLPFWGALYLALRFIHQRHVVPRVGQVSFGAARQARLWRFSLVMLAINVLALAFGALAFVAFPFSDGAGFLVALTLSLTVLLAFSLGAYYLDIPRFFLYGVLLTLGPPVGEWLWQRGLASHHGYPLVFGLAASAIAAVGLARLARVLRTPPPSIGHPGAAESHG